ncbi:MAG: hypothetical protein CVU32_01800 [Betaproteobacteria bacterium HGW-Betaproteobacteria-5]|jgi:hypothetical protein|nr:MAG: hypothetical protein CVU32_01800 [Betaproteobacteria bacterium HGW-Betaproteobacteria-5]PKO40146.1 MAG: hypothetical protein CVU33_03010 [Betaproteobacteria bacterium HGW-Betaproteobacteria-6]PKO93193.1 MAG: hypothetical protein CVU16_05815 [Betaproteobacteria bacterium HGW-Betaproteobacteria-10]
MADNLTLELALLIHDLATNVVDVDKKIAAITKMEGPAGKDGADGAHGKAGERGPKGEPGEQGPQGERGPMPDHKWDGTKLTFQKPDGKWGKAVDLKGKPGTDGGTVIIRSGGSSSGIGTLLPGTSDDPTGIVVFQAGNAVNMPWPAFISSIAGAIDMGVESARRTDFVGDTIIYRGEAAPGSLESNPVWKIKRIEFAPDGDVTEKWAGGTAAFDKVWNDRTTLEYI